MSRSRHRAAVDSRTTGARGFRHINGVFAVNDGARRATRFAHARAQLGQLLVGVDHVALDGLAGRGVVATVVDRYPKALVALRAAEIGPGHTACHAGGVTFTKERVLAAELPSAHNARSRAFRLTSSIMAGR